MESATLEEAAAVSNRRDSSRKSQLWEFFGKRVPRSKIVFVCQILVIYTVVGMSLFNLTRGKDPAESQIWIALLGSCLGYVLPNPSLDPETRQGGE